MSSLQTSKAVGPDNIPNRLLKDFAFESAPLVCDIYNQSLREGYVPALLKSCIATPMPKVSPPGLSVRDLRPISLTCTMAKVMEGFTCSRLLSQLEGKIDPCQFSRQKGTLQQMLLDIRFKRSTKQLIVVKRRLGYFSLIFLKGLI